MTKPDTCRHTGPNASKLLKLNRIMHNRMSWFTFPLKKYADTNWYLSPEKMHLPVDTQFKCLIATLMVNKKRSIVMNFGHMKGTFTPNWFRSNKWMRGEWFCILTADVWPSWSFVILLKLAEELAIAMQFSIECRIHEFYSYCAWGFKKAFKLLNWSLCKDVTLSSCGNIKLHSTYFGWSANLTTEYSNGK